MFSKKILMVIVVSAASAWFAGCSNDSLQPASMSQVNLMTVDSVPTGARDIGAGGGNIWVVSQESKDGFNNYLYTRSGNGWQRDNDAAGNYCAVSASGKCFYNDASGNIYYGSLNSWNQWSCPHHASHIAVGYNGVETPWIVDVDGKVRKYNNNTGNWDDLAFPTIAWKVSVPANDPNIAWALDRAGSLYKYNGSWSGPNALMRGYDVAAGQDYQVYIVSTENYLDQGYKIYRANNPNSLTPPEGWTWLYGLGDMNKGISGAFGTGALGKGCYIINRTGLAFKYDGTASPVQGRHYWEELQ